MKFLFLGLAAIGNLSALWYSITHFHLSNGTWHSLAVKQYAQIGGLDLPVFMMIFVNSLTGFVVLTATIQRIKHYPYYMQGQGFLLIIWMCFQLSGDPSLYYPTLHLPCMMLGLLLFMIGWRLREVERV